MRRTVVALAVVLGVIGIPAPASAHGQLAFAEPAHQSTVTEVMERVALYFTEAPASTPIFSVTSPGGTQTMLSWSHGQPRPLPSPVQELNLVNGTWEPVFYNTGFPAMLYVTHWPEQGIYTVKYEHTASDGDKVKGEVRFDYQGPLTTAAPQPPAASPQDETGGTFWFWLIPLVILIGLGAASLYLQNKRKAVAKQTIKRGKKAAKSSGKAKTK
jgi:methionine-rich copper-binding protein CopC